MIVVGRKPLDRRQSARWTSGKTLAWRRARGRRVHRSQVSERSLNGLALEGDLPASVEEGDAIHPVDRRDAIRHGFTHAVVRRLERQGRGPRRILLEILA